MNKGLLAGLSALAGGVTGAGLGIAKIGTTLNRRVNEEYQRAEKHLLIMQIMNQWLIDLQEGKKLSGFFEDNHFNTVAIYGMSYLGERLIDELKDTNIKVLYGIDRNAANIYSEIEVYTPDESLPKVDVIVVTSAFYYDEIERDLQKKVSYPIISIEDVVYEV